jgi:hypothetical protein
MDELIVLESNPREALLSRVVIWNRPGDQSTHQTISAKRFRSNSDIESELFEGHIPIVPTVGN